MTAQLSALQRLRERSVRGWRRVPRELNLVLIGLLGMRPAEILIDKGSHVTGLLIRRCA